MQNTHRRPAKDDKLYLLKTGKDYKLLFKIIFLNLWRGKLPENQKKKQTEKFRHFENKRES